MKRGSYRRRYTGANADVLNTIEAMRREDAAIFTKDGRKVGYRCRGCGITVWANQEQENQLDGRCTACSKP
jgi:hypothetical protein